MSDAELLDAESLIEDALALARIPAPPFGEEARGEEMLRRFMAIPGWRVERDSVGNVIARREDAGADDGAVWLLAHLDTVFPAETPLVFTRSDGVLRGPGIGDNAIALAAVLAVARRHSASPDARPVVIACTVGEEGLGNLRGANALLSGPAAGAACVLAIEGHRGDEIGSIAVGSIRYRASVRGPGGHSWWDRGAVSALHVLIQFCQQVIEDASAISVDLVTNVGSISGGTGVTAIAASAEAIFEARSPSDADLDGFALLVERCAADGPLPIEVALLGRRPGGVLPVTHPLVAAAQGARRRAGLPAAAAGSSSSDANPFIAAGLPAVCIGVTTGWNAHQLDEAIDIAPAHLGVEALIGLTHQLSTSDEVCDPS